MTHLAAVEGTGSHRVLVLHGWVMDSSVWLATRSLSDVSASTYAYVDFPGYGTNRGDVALPESIDEMAAVALEAVKELGWSTYSVLGHSMGGTTALRVATLAPDDVTSVVAISPVTPAGTPLDEASHASFAAAFDDPAAAVQNVLSPTMKQDDLDRLGARNRASLDRAAWERYLRNWLEPDFFDDLTAYTGPVSLMGGEHDPLVTQEYLADIATGIPHATVRSIANAGHYPMIESPQATVDAIEAAFLQR